MLNKAQERRLSSSLRIVEDSLREIDRMIEASDYSAILKEVKHDVPEKTQAAIRNKLSLIRNKIEIITEGFNLSKTQIESSRYIRTKLSHCWQVLEDAKTIKLKRFGETSREVEDTLDPQINEIIDIVQEMEHLFG